MTDLLPPDVKTLLGDPASAMVLVTLNEDGSPHAAVTDFLRVSPDGAALHYLEPLESSLTGKNLVRSIWFDRPVAVALKGTSGRRWQIKARVARAHIAGPVFEQYYRELRERLGDIDLAAVWVIEPVSVEEQDFAQEKAFEEQTRPFYRHLDRIARIS